LSAVLAGGAIQTVWLAEKTFVGFLVESRVAFGALTKRGAFIAAGYAFNAFR
jgi:hypothetical protein